MEKKNKIKVAAFAALTMLSATAFAENLVPDKPSKGPNIWCTWGIQNGIGGEQAEKVRETVKREIAFEGDQGGGADFARSCINEDLIFGENGWANFWPEIRKDVYMLLDDGWDVPYNTPAKKSDAFGSFELDEKKFPSCTGNPAQRLKTLNKMLKERGWRGAGVWVSAQAKGETRNSKLSAEALRKYWKERVLWSKKAGVSYWKVDWGVHEHDLEFRKMLSQLADKYYPELFVEHAVPSAPFNDFDVRKMRGSGEFSKTKPNVLSNVDGTVKFSNVFRTYDVLPPIESTTTVDRAAYELLSGRKSGSRAILSVENNMSLSVGLGAAVGIMDWDNVVHDSGVRWGAIRAVLWQRIAPAVPMKDLEIFVSKERLEDVWTFKPNSVWFVAAWGKPVKQSAPAVVSRGIENPKVKPRNGMQPYVQATLHPNGSFALSMTPRMTADSDRIYTPCADVDVNLDCLNRKICLFDVNGDISFKLGTDKKVEVLAQDLLEKEAIDVSDSVKISDGKLTIPASLGKKIVKRRNGDRTEAYVLLVREKK